MSVEMTQYPNAVFETYRTFQPVVTIFPMIPIPCWYQDDILIETEAELRPIFYSDSHVTIDELIAKAVEGQDTEVNTAEFIVFNSYGAVGTTTTGIEVRKKYDYRMYRLPEKSADGGGLILRSKRQYGMPRPQSFWNMGGLHIYQASEVFTDNNNLHIKKSPQALLDSLSWKLLISRVTVKAELVPYDRPL